MKKDKQQIIKKEIKNEKCNHPQWEEIDELMNFQKVTICYIQKCKRCGIIKKLKI